MSIPLIKKIKLTSKDASDADGNGSKSNNASTSTATSLLHRSPMAKWIAPHFGGELLSEKKLATSIKGSERRSRKWSIGQSVQSSGMSDTQQPNRQGQQPDSPDQQYKTPHEYVHRQHTTGRFKNINVEEFLDWKELRPEDLPLPAKKMSELVSWFRTAHDKKNIRPPVLVLCGPPGTCKTTSVKVLAANLNIGLSELKESEYITFQKDKFGNLNVVSTLSEVMVKCGKYKSLMMREQQIINLVDNMPEEISKTPNVISEMISTYDLKFLSPLIIITNTNWSSAPLESREVQKDEGDLGSKTNYRKYIDVIQMKPLTATNMKNALKKLKDRVKTKYGSVLSEEEINRVASTSNGDLRSAINICISSIRSTDSSSSCMKETAPTTFIPDVQHELFSSIGRVLYSKKITDKNTKKMPREKNNRLSQFVNDPQKIATDYAPQANSFINLVHENYPKIFSDINSVAEAADSLSTSDIVLSEWKEGNFSNELGLSIAVRGVMNANKNPVRKFTPIIKSQLQIAMYSVQKSVRREEEYEACSYEDCRATQTK